MYKISVPVDNGNLSDIGRENVLSELKKVGAERVFFAMHQYETDPARRSQMLADLKENCRYFHENGFEVGAWLWAFWVKGENSFKCMRSLDGEEIKGFACPSDADFRTFAAEYISDAAKCGVDLIMFDDDFRYGFYCDQPACLCDNHVAMINEEVGEKHTREELRNLICSGGKNKYRSAYLKANGDAFRIFAKEMRDAVDKVNPDIRMGACACMTSWDVDGITAYETAKILAGKTKPFVRLIGAPYWACARSWGNDLQDVVELERMESVWTREDEIEIMAEGDAWPRPRIKCPANYLEGFDTAIRAAGCTDGILKYVLDYHSKADYETGYVRMHERNKLICEAIGHVFHNKKSVGVRVYESMKKTEDVECTTAVNDKTNFQDLFFSKAARILAHGAIPSVHEGDGVTGICFDENARSLSLENLKNGLIIDIAAAQILESRGVDVGIKSIGKPLSVKCERFADAGNTVLADNATVYDVALRNGAEVLSVGKNDQQTVPMSYRYENSDGNRFLVLCFNTRKQCDASFYGYARSEQIAKNVFWLSGKNLPAYSYGNPHLYMQCKADEKTLAVGLWNFCADPIFQPVVELGENYDKIEFINCDGKLCGNLVSLSEIAPYGFAAFVAKKL